MGFKTETLRRKRGVIAYTELKMFVTKGKVYANVMSYQVKNNCSLRVIGPSSVPWLSHSDVTKATSNTSCSNLILS